MHAALVALDAGADAAAGARIHLSASALSDGRPVLLAIEAAAGSAAELRASVHAEDAIAGNILLDEIRAALKA